MRTKKIIGIGVITSILIVGSFIGFSLISSNFFKSNKANGFPDFNTKTEDYFVTNIGIIPEIREISYESKKKSGRSSK